MTGNNQYLVWTSKYINYINMADHQIYLQELNLPLALVQKYVKPSLMNHTTKPKTARPVLKPNWSAENSPLLEKKKG